MADDRPTTLFDDSEGTRADLKSLLGIALLKSKANLYLAQLMIWIFNTTDRGKPTLKKSYDELADRPWGLCCSRNQAYATVQKAKRLGLLSIKTTWTGPGIQGANEYAIDWVGVRKVVGLRQPVTYPTTCDPPPTTCDPPPTTCDPPPTTWEHIEEDTFVHRLTPSYSAVLTSDIDGTSRDGAMRADAFTEEELAAVRFKANTIDKWIAATDPADRQLILKLATLWHDGELPDDAVEQVLESFQRKRESGVVIDRPCGWLWSALRNQLAKHRVKLEQLLASTRWPRQLLTRQPQTQETQA
jgi:hypothetical protein